MRASPTSCSWLRDLAISGATIKPPSVEPLRRLPGLTALCMRNCQLEDLPDGPYLSSLRRCVKGAFC